MALFCIKSNAMGSNDKSKPIASRLKKKYRYVYMLHIEKIKNA